jgi:hypothetical protein
MGTISVAVISLAAAIVTFLPSVSIVQPGSFDPTHPFSSPFQIKNTNIIPLDNLQVYIGICNIFTSQIAPGLHKCERDKEARLSTFWISMARWKFSRIAKDAEVDVPLGDAVNIAPPMVLVAGDIVVSVVYNLWFLPWTYGTAKRFYTRRQADGQLYWLETTLDDAPFY